MVHRDKRCEPRANEKDSRPLNNKLSLPEIGEALLAGGKSPGRINLTEFILSHVFYR
jgi:hypothetical protein